MRIGLMLNVLVQYSECFIDGNYSAHILRGALVI